MTEQRVLAWMLIEEAGAVLLARRKAERAPFAGQWTLPGDVMEEWESASETLARFARDQLGVSITSEEFVDTLVMSESEIEYAANVFRVAIEGRPRYRESGPYDDARWVLPAESPQPIAEPLATLLKSLSSSVRTP
jgi:ADP-ribose pyrophosphatase YjhB (NUDIX family)